MIHHNPVLSDELQVTETALKVIGLDLSARPDTCAEARFDPRTGTISEVQPTPPTSS